MDKVIHDNKEKGKKYVIPTNGWLEPIKPLLDKNNISLNTKGLLILSNMIDNGEVVVKVSKNIDYNKVKNINKLVKNLPNMMHTFLTFKCFESEINYISQYRDLKGFCKGDKSDIENIEIALEVMKLYDFSLDKYNRKMKIDKVKIILKQLLLCQLNAFEKVGFLHMDIHLGNYLIKKKEEELIYTINKRKYKYKFDFKVILMDYDQSIIMPNSDISPLPPHREINTLMYNIIKTIQVISHLLPLNEGNEMLKNIDKTLKLYSFDMLGADEKNSRAYYKGGKYYQLYIEKSIWDNLTFVNDFWKISFNEYLFPEYTLEYDK